MNDLNITDRLVQMVQLNTCTSQLETPRVQENARTQDLVTARSGGDRSWSRAQTAGVRWHLRGGSTAHARLCARPMAQSRMSLCALAAIGTYTRHCGASERATAQAEARAAMAALQSTGHLMTEPLPTHEPGRVIAFTLGLPMGELTLPD